MRSLKIVKYLKPVGKIIASKGPEILTVLSVSGLFTTVALGMKAHASTVEERAGYCEELLTARTNEEKADILKDAIRELGPVYAPMAISGALTVACILTAHHIQTKRAAALATAYSLAEKTLAAYQEKALEKLGEEGGKELMQAVSDKLAEDDAPFDGGYSYRIDGDGKTLCYDRVTGRYFRSSVENIRAAESAVNKRLIDESMVRLGEFYYELGIDDGGFICDGFGWDISRSPLEIYFTSMLDRENNPCLVLNYNVSLVDRRAFDGRR